MLRRLQPDFAAAALLLALPLVLFWPVVFGGRTLLPADNLTAQEPWRSAAAQLGVNGPPHNQLLDDLVLENYLWKKFLRESLQAGQIPLWNPYLFTGVPFLAAGQHSALYPFSVLYYVLPLPLAYGVFTVVQFFIAGLFMYVFLRVLGLRRPGALFGGVLYQLCGFMVVSVVFQMIIAAAAWLPLVLTSLELIARQQPALGGRPATVPWMALGALALGLQVLAGHVEITYYTLMVSGAFAAWRLGGLWRQSRSRNFRAGGDAPAGRLYFAGRAAAMLGLAAFGLALAAIQFIPLYELASTSFRTGRATFDEIIGWAFPWRHVLVYLVPNFYGNPSHHAYFDLFTWQWTPATVNARGEAITTIDWGIKNYVEGGTYLGLLPLLLTFITLVVWARTALSRLAGSRRQGARSAVTSQPASLPPATFHSTVPFFLLLAFFALAFAFPTRLYALIFWLPGINQLHSAFRWVWPLGLAVAVLAAYGVEWLQSSACSDPLTERPRPPSPVLRLLGLGAPPSLATALAALAVWGGLATLLGLALARWQYAPLAGWMDRAVQELALADRAFRDGRMFFSYTAAWVALFAAMLIASGLVLRLSRSSWTWRGRPAWPYLAIGVLAADLLAAGWGFNPAADPKILDYVPPSAEFLKQDTGLWRFTTYAPRNKGEKPYNANMGWYFNFQDVRGYDSLFSRQYADYMGLIEEQYELLFNRIAPIDNITALNSPLFDLLNIKYVISLEPIPNDKFTLVYDGEVKVYRNETAMPRAYTLPQTATLATDDFAQAARTFDARQYVIVPAADAAGDAAARPARAAPAAVTAYAGNEVWVDAAMDEPSWLILNDAYFPGWKAFRRPIGAADDAEQELDITRVNGNFRGVTLPPGAWTVRFRYTPAGVRLGGIVSFLAGMTLVFLVGVWLWRYFYQESKIDSAARRIAKNSLAPLALNLMNRAVDLVFAAFYIRVLGPEGVGKYYYAVVIFSWFEIISNYGLNAYLIREVARDRAHSGRYLLNTTVLRLWLGAAIIPGLALVLGLLYVLPSLPFASGIEPLTADVLWAIGLLVLAQAPATVSTGLSALFQAYEKAEYPAAVTTITTLLKVSLGTVVLVLGLDIVGLAATSLVVNAVTVGILAGLAWRLTGGAADRPSAAAGLDWGLQRGALRESFPLMLNNLLATLFYKVDVTLLQPLRGPTEVGWYSTGYKFVDAYNVIPSMFTFALFPVMARQAHRQDRREDLRFTYLFAVKVLVAIALPLAVLNTVLAPVLIGLLGGAEFLPNGATALILLAWSMPFGWINSVTNYVLISLGQQRALTRAFAVALLFNVAVNLVFIPSYGFAAAAAITILSEIVEGLAFYYFLRRSLGGMPWPGLLWRLWAGAGAMTAVIYGLWALHPFVALAAGLAVYVAALVGLRAFDDEEQRTLLGILPGRLRQRLAPAENAPGAD